MMNRDDSFGAQVAEHAGRAGKLTLVLGGTGAAIGAVLVLSAALNLARGDMPALLSASAMALSCLLAAGLCGLAAFVQARRHVRVFERGLVFSGALGTRRVAFSELAAIHHIMHRQQSRAELALRDGSHLVLEGFQDIPQLVAMLRHGAQR